MIVFVVIGHAGDYDYYRTWMTKGFEDEINAKEYKHLCTEEARRITLELQELNDTLLKQWQDTGDPNDYWERYAKIAEDNKVDEYFDHDELIDYTIEELEIK
jgi:hypothetical protein